MNVSKEMIAAAKAAYWHEVHNGGGYSDKCYEAAISAALSRPIDNAGECQACKGRGIIGGMYRVGDGDVDGWEEPCHDCSPSPVVTVKPLVWEYREQQMMTYVVRDYRGIVYHINQTFGSDSYYFTTVKYDGSILYDGDDLPSAQAAAQADHDAAILSAISSPPVAPVGVGGGWQVAPEEMTNELLSATTKGRQVLAYEKGRYYNAWMEFEASEGGWLWMDDADSEPAPSHYRVLPAEPALSPKTAMAEVVEEKP